MNEFTLAVIGVAGVSILVVFEILKWVKTHPTSPIAEKIESKIPPAVLAAAGIPAITGDHAVALVTATGNAVATAVQAVAQATQPGAFASYGIGQKPATAADGNALDVRGDEIKPEAARPTSKPSGPDFWRGDNWFNPNLQGKDSIAFQIPDDFTGPVEVLMSGAASGTVTGTATINGVVVYGPTADPSRSFQGSPGAAVLEIDGKGHIDIKLNHAR